MLNEIDKIFEEGVTFYEQGKLDEAEAKFLEALQYDPKSDEIKYNLALVYLEKKEYEKSNYLVSQISEIDCEEILDELEKVDFEFENDNPLINIDDKKSNLLEQKIEYYNNKLNDEYLPININCEFCDLDIELSEIERQNKFYNCPVCKSENNVREKERALESEFLNKPDVELFEMLIDSQNFRLEYSFAAKREIIKRGINLPGNEDFMAALKNYL